MAFENQQVADSFELLVAFFLDIDLSDQAYIFSIINTTQSKLDPSLVQDLSELSDITTPEKIAHSIAKVFNKRADSPWYQMIKLLGKRDSLSSKAIISQYSFNRSILNYIYDKNYAAEIRNILKENKNKRSDLNQININKDKFIFWDFYVHSEEGILYLILNAYFSALQEVFITKWCKPESILCKTTGYDAFMKLFKDFYYLANKDIGKLKTKDFYTTILKNKIVSKINLEDESYKLGAAGASNLYNDLFRLFK
jgi:DGQHR domain-containing protein